MKPIPWYGALALISLYCAATIGCSGSSGMDNTGGIYRTSLCSNTIYPAEELSAYVLPWPVGERYLVGQGNCVPAGAGSHAVGSRAEYAYDILMPIGTSLLAVRSGQVIYAEDRFPDSTRDPADDNTIVVQHDDGTISNYGHITTLGALVEVGDTVDQGDVIALSGDSGASTEPHLHFEILSCVGDPILFDPVVSFNPTCRSLPTTFRNTRAHPQGLVEGQRYEARAF